MAVELPESVKDDLCWLFVGVVVVLVVCTLLFQCVPIVSRGITAFQDLSNRP
jgi:hypothetical protein